MSIDRRRLTRHWLVIGAAAVVGATAAVLSLGPAAHHAGAAAGHRAGAVGSPAAPGALVWADDFNGPAGSAPDPSKWNHETGGGGFGNKELEYYTDSTGNAALDGNGDLVITARSENPAGYGCWYGSCRYTSARLNTDRKFTQQYGHIEARIKMPRGRGMWPAFWAVGSDIGSVGWPASGEMDIMETIGTTANLNHGSLHGPGYSAASSLTGTYPLPKGQSFADAFHTFAIDWVPDRVSFLIDGVTYETHAAAETDGHPWAYNHPFYLLLNVAVGGVWPGPPDAGASFPQQMVIDYVHVYARGSDDSGGGPGTITGTGGRCLDVSGADNAGGTAIQLSTCDGTRGQSWSHALNTFQALGKCMDVTGAGTANGTKVQLYDCNGTDAQDWTVNGSQLVNVGSGKCLDAPGAGSADNTRLQIDDTRLQIWDCTGGGNQQWTVR